MADIELARAYVEIIPVTKGISKKTMDEVFPSTADAEGSAKRSGAAFSSKLGSVLKKSAIGVGVAAGGLLATSLVKGFGRLSAIENAEAKLRGLGNSASDVSAIMDNALASVRGTAFGMDEAATTAASAVAAGIKPGKELESYLSLVGDAATIAGTSMSDMGSIFNKVATSGKVQGDVFAQLGDKGIPIVALLSEKLGVSAEEVYKLGREGKITSADFLDAMSSMSGAALEGGNTTSGAFKNMGAALGRFGAALLSGVFPLIGPFFGTITGVIDEATAAIGPMIERITPGMQAVAQTALDTLNMVVGSVGGIVEVFRSGDFDPSKWAEGVHEDSPLVTVAFAIRDAWVTVRDTMTPVLSTIRDWIIAAIPHVRALWGWFSELSLGAKAVFGGSVLATGLAAFGKLGSVFSGVAGSVKKLMGPLSRFTPLLRFLGGPIGLIVAGLVTLIATNDDVRASFGDLFEVLGDTIGTTLATLAPVLADLAVAMGPVLAAAAVAVGHALEALAPVVVWIVDGFAKLIEWLQPAMPLIVGVAGAVFGAVKIFGVLVPILTSAWAIITKVVAAVKLGAWVFTALTGPIGWVVLAVTAVGVALWAFFTKTEKGRALWDKIWGGIKSAVAAVVDWVTGTAWPALQTAWDAIAGAAMWLYESAILPAWDGIKTALDAVVTWVTGTLWPGIVAAWDAIAAGASWLYESIILPVWQGIKTAIAIAVTAVLVYIDLLKWYFEKVIAPVAMWLWQNVLAPAWAGIKVAIEAVVGWVRDTAWPALKSAYDAIAGAATWLWQSIMKPAWDGIKAAVSAVVDWLTGTAWPFIRGVWDAIGAGARFLLDRVIRPVWNGIRSAIGAVVDWLRNTAWKAIETVIGWLKMSFEGWRLLAAAVWSAVKSAVKAVTDWLTGTAWPVIRGVIDKIKSGFETMRDRVRDAWNFVKDRVINPVATWFRDTIGGLFDRATRGITSAFETMRDAVGRAFDAVRDKAKKPVKFIVETIVRDGIVKKFNDVASVFGVKTIDTGKFRVGWSSGGYTGPGSKYTPAGVVHADEYVIRKESQNSIRNRAPGLLDALNRHGAAALDMLGYATGGWVKPFRGSFSVNSPYGRRGGRQHAGVDFPTPSGTALVAVDKGTVVGRGWNPAAGNKLSLQTSLPGIVAGYHHLSRFAASLGETVAKGQVIGYSGNTGRSTGPHLHFSIKRDGKYVDPGPYLNGTGIAGDGGGGWNPFAGLWDSLKAKVRDGVGSTPFGDALYEVPKTVVDGALGWASSRLAALGDWASDTLDDVTGKARWTGVATQALMMTGNMGPRNLASLLRRMGQESGYNPRAINNWDSNAKAGTPSKGLMQVIDPTFRAYRDGRAPNDIWDPLANILASIHYTKARYGSLRKGWDRAGGYADGGLVSATLYDRGGWLAPGAVGVNLSSRPEPVFTGAQWDLLARGFEEQRTARPGSRWGDDELDALAEAVAAGTRDGSREGVAAGLAGSAGRARAASRMGV